jgi:hypothetical protein
MALFGGHIETTVIKTKQEGRNFGIDVELNVDGYLRKYTGNPNRYYSDYDAPGKVAGYRFKTFYLVPDKKHFLTFWDKVVSKEWLESDHPNARALRAARGNLNHVWRVLHRVTYVSRVPPIGDRPASSSEKPTRAVIHQVPNRGIINLVLDVMREGVTSTGQSIAELSEKEQIGAAVADVIDNQWALSVPWWQGYIEHAQENEGDRIFDEYRDIKQAVYEYMLAYFETGAAADDERLHRPPIGPPVRVTDGLRVLYTFQEGSGKVVTDVSGVGEPLDLTIEDTGASWDPGRLVITEQALVATPGPATKLIEAAKASNEITIEAWVKPADAAQCGPARIVTLSVDTGHRNFTLGQGANREQEDGTKYVVRLRTTKTNDNGTDQALEAGDVTTDGLSHLVYVREASGKARFYLNAIEVGSRRVRGNFSNWDDDYRLGLGNEFTKDRLWRGELHLVAIYNRALGPAEIEQNYDVGADTTR